MTASVAEALAEVSNRLNDAYRCAEIARQRLEDAVGIVAGLDRSDLEAELLRADQELARVLGLISGGAESVAEFESRL